jgi:signal peptidase I
MRSAESTQADRTTGGETSARSTGRGPQKNESIKDTFESIVIAFILAFVFRAYVVEAFVIPTGSMAPTLLGRHLRVQCSHCGYKFQSDPDERLLRDTHGRVRPFLNRDVGVICPMCRNNIKIDKYTRVFAGDRILVHKYIYTLSNPKRWEVVVFKNPSDPGQNFIKRLVGLPREQLLIVEGNVYTSKDGSTWQVARKTDRPDVQRAVWQPIHNSRHVPLDESPVQPARWVGVEGTAESWQIDGRRSYVYDSKAPGTIRFQFTPNDANVYPWYPYNQMRVPTDREQPIEDIRLSVSFQPQQAGLGLRLQTTARWQQQVLDAPPVKLSASIDAGGKATLNSTGEDGKNLVLDSVQLDPAPPGVAREVELWHVDQELSMWVDGRRILRHAYEVAPEILLERDPLQDEHLYPEVTISVWGAPTTLHRVQVARDLYYSSGKPNAPNEAGLGTINKRGANFDKSVAILEEGQFFCLGDNSPMSQDSRFWQEPNDWIVKRMFKEGADAAGIVPKQLMMGRAFFVYFPAALSWNERTPPFVPNFGQMRFIR